MRSGALTIAQGAGRRSKYGVGLSPTKRAARTYNGVTYDSLLETRYAIKLDLRVAAGDIRSWRRQIPFVLYSGRPESLSAIVCEIRVDFAITHNDGHTEYVECKGMDTDLYRLKAKMFAACYPEITITMVRK
jgi:hypothetical protein